MIVFVGASHLPPIPVVVYLDDLSTWPAFSKSWRSDARDGMSQHCELVRHIFFVHSALLSPWMSKKGKPHHAARLSNSVSWVPCFTSSYL